MTESHSAVLERLSAEFAAMSQQMAKVSAELNGLDRVLAAVVAPQHQTPAPQPVPQPVPAQPHWQPYAAPVGAWPVQGWPQPMHANAPVQPRPPATIAAAAPPPPQMPVAPRPAPQPPRPSDGGWIGKVLAVAGVGVTLIGVVLLVVLAAQAGILRPEIRVVAGGVLAGALVGIASWFYRRPGGRVGAVALAATGVAAAYIDVIAVTNVYEWVSAPIGLLVAGLVGGGGLLLARRWDSQALGLLVFVPLIVLAPVVTDGVTMLLVGFMLALAAATLPFQLGRDWTALHAARVAAPTFPLVLATVLSHFGSDTDRVLLGAGSLIAALIAVIAAVVLLPTTTNRVAMATITALGTLPVLMTPAALPGFAAAGLCAALAVCLLLVVFFGKQLPGVAGIVAHIWSALASVSALVAVLAAFDGRVAAPVLLAMSVTLAVAGRVSGIARWASMAFAVVAALIFADNAPPSRLVDPTTIDAAQGVSTLVTSVLLAAAALVIAWMWLLRDGADREVGKLLWALAAAVLIYAVTTFTVTAGVLAGGVDGGFLAGHMAATICWIVMAAALFGYAARRGREERSLPIWAGLTLTGASTAKLFLFDLGTLSGIFRVIVFIVVGLVLLGMGAGYARLLAQQDRVLDDRAGQSRPASSTVTDQTPSP